MAPHDNSRTGWNSVVRTTPSRSSRGSLSSPTPTQKTAGMTKRQANSSSSNLLSRLAHGVAKKLGLEEGNITISAGEAELRSLDQEAFEFEHKVGLLQKAPFPTTFSYSGDHSQPLKSLWCGLNRGCRQWILELLEFAGWFIVGCIVALQIPAVWYVFWAYIIPEKPARPSLRHGLPLWLMWVVALIYYRYKYKRIAPPDLVSVVRHLEVFLLASLFSTLSANFCTYLHTPGETLFDIGFLIVPEQSEHSKWRPVSDILAQAIPAFLILRCFFFPRRPRCQAYVNWLRCVSLGYFFRSLVAPLTSLPGPAPHCTVENFNAPQGWHDIATKLGPLVGDYRTCGDLVYSGHTAFTTITVLCLVKTYRGRRGYGIAIVLGILYVAMMCTLALAGRKHYSVDVAVALLVSILMFLRFHDGWNGVPAAVEDDFIATRKDTVDYNHEERNGRGVGQASPLPSRILQIV